MATAVGDYKTKYQEMDLDGLRAEYEAKFGEPAMADTDDGPQPTNDKAALVGKLAYADLMAEYKDSGEEVPARVRANADKWFDRPFQQKKAKEKRYTIQMFITDYLWDKLQNGEDVSAEELGAAVCEKFPDSTYSKNPVGRAMTDINKFNKNLFACQEELDKVPNDETGYVTPTDKRKKQTEEEASDDE